MKKSDLKIGDVAKLRNGMWILVTENDTLIDIAEGKKMFFNLNEAYDEDLNCTIMCNECLDIVSVYSNPVLNVVHYDKFWERKSLTNEEKIILQNLDKSFKYITRDKNGELWLWKTEKLFKSGKDWIIGEGNCGIERGCLNFIAYNHLFKCVSWDDENPTDIEELLYVG